MSDMAKPKVILAPHWRRMGELFSDDARKQLHDRFDLVWGKDEVMPEQLYKQAFPECFAIVSAMPALAKEDIGKACNLRAIIEVSGAFPDTIDYEACRKANIEVLSCSPGFRESVAEMGLAMLLAGARGLVQEHERFRIGTENWLQDNVKTDFSIFQVPIGFVGFGQIAKEITRLLAPFNAQIRAFDPWLPEHVANESGIELMPLESLVKTCRAVLITAVPTAENKHLINAKILGLMPDHALLIILSRAHLVDFDALVEELQKGRLRVVIDVFPEEPMDKNHPIRKLPSAILSPHRAAAVDKGRQLIGDMIVADLSAILNDKDDRRLAQANESKISLLTSVGDAKKVGALMTDVNSQN